MADLSYTISYLKEQRERYGEFIKINESHRSKMDAVDIIQSYAEDDCYRDMIDTIDKVLEMISD